jgi:hypothetical protein
LPLKWIYFMVHTPWMSLFTGDRYAQIICALKT